MITDKQILILGGAGFIGSNLCRHLLDMGNRVWCIDDLSTGRIANVLPLMGNRNFRFVFHDIINPFKIPVPLDIIFNLACPASPKHYRKDGVKTLRTSFEGSLNALELAREHDATLVFSSTSEVYGCPAIDIQHESYWGNVNPNGERSCYDEGKRAAETLHCEYVNQFGVKAKIVRIFNTYGENMQPDDGRVIPGFVVPALKGEPMWVNGDGTQTRSFMHVSDLLDGLCLMAEFGECGSPVNLGNPEEIRIIDLAALVLELTESSGHCK